MRAVIVPVDIRLELGEAHPVLGDVQLRFGVVDLRLRRAQRLLRLIELGLGREALRQQVASGGRKCCCASTSWPSRGGQRRLRRAQRVQFVLRVELRQHLVGLDRGRRHWPTVR